MKNESIKKSAKTDRMRIKIRSVTVGSAAFAIMLSIFQQGAAQIVPNNSYANMLNANSIGQQIFNHQINGDNQSLSNLRQQLGNSPQAVPDQGSRRPAAPFPITATDFRPIFQWMAPDLVANWQPGLTPEQKEGLKALASQILTGFEAHNRKNNVATAMTYLFAVSYTVNTGHLLSGTECDQWTMAFNNALAANVDFITMSPRDKQLKYELAVVTGGMIAFLSEQENPAQQSEAREMARTTLRNLGFNAR
jgi:Family of unknown function (DUF6683)